MQQELKDRIKNTLPEFVMDNLYDDHTFDANGKIISGYIKTDDPQWEEETNAMKDILGLVTLKEIKIEDKAKNKDKNIWSNGIYTIVCRAAFKFSCNWKSIGSCYGSRQSRSDLKRVY